MSFKFMTFGIVMGVFFMAFAHCAHVIFHQSVPGYDSLGGAAMSLFRALLGDFDYNEFANKERVIGPLFFTAYIIALWLFLLNLLISVVTGAYEELMAEGFADEVEEEVAAANTMGKLSRSHLGLSNAGRQDANRKKTLMALQLDGFRDHVDSLFVDLHSALEEQGGTAEILIKTERAHEDLKMAHNEHRKHLSEQIQVAFAEEKKEMQEALTTIHQEKEELQQRSHEAQIRATEIELTAERSQEKYEETRAQLSNTQEYLAVERAKTEALAKEIERVRERTTQHVAEGVTRAHALEEKNARLEVALERATSALAGGVTDSSKVEAMQAVVSSNEASLRSTTAELIRARTQLEERERVLQEKERLEKALQTQVDAGLAREGSHKARIIVLDTELGEARRDAHRIRVAYNERNQTAQNLREMLGKQEKRIAQLLAELADVQSRHTGAVQKHEEATNRILQLTSDMGEMSTLRERAETERDEGVKRTDDLVSAHEREIAALKAHIQELLQEQDLFHAHLYVMRRLVDTTHAHYNEKSPLYRGPPTGLEEIEMAGRSPSTSTYSEQDGPVITVVPGDEEKEKDGEEEASHSG